MSDDFTLDTQTDATVGITDTVKTNDNTPTFSGTSSNVEGDITITVGGAIYAVTPNVDDGTWRLDTEAVTSTDGTFNLTEDGDYTITADAEDVDGNAITQVSDDFTLDTQTDATVGITDTVKTNDNTPTFSGTSSNVEGDITITVGGAIYAVTPNVDDGTWTLDTEAATSTDGTFNLTEDGNYTITADADNNTKIYTATFYRKPLN
ncbi:MAG TPA: hypothetical protein ENL00_03930 [Nitratifractor sp.]|nr:hypothetical protein [Nitratifractor sp.]